MESTIKSVTLIIPGRLDNLNDYTNECRANKYGGGECKKKNEEKITEALADQIEGLHFTGRSYMHFKWYEPNRQRDLDNVCFAKKFILDVLVRKKVIETDGWKGIIGFMDDFGVDAEFPRIEVTIEGRLKDEQCS